MTKKNELEIETVKLQQMQIKQQTKNSEVLQKLAEKGLPMLKDYFDAQTRHIDAPKLKLSLFGFLSLLAIVVIGSMILVLKGKMDAGNLTFLLGTFVGASITFLGELVLPRE